MKPHRISGLILALSACHRATESGEILEKRFEPSQEMSTPGYTPQDKRRGNGRVTLIDDEDYILVLKQGTRQKEIYVDRTVYERFDVGDYFDVGRWPFRETDNPPKRKE